MKKAIASGLVGLIALGGVAVGAPAAFAQDTDTETPTQEAREEARAERQAARAERRAQRVETLTSILGVSADDLAAAKESGQTLADVAAAQGIELQTVIDELVDDAEVRIEEKLAAGEIDAERAAAKLERIEDRITARVNGEGPDGRRGGPRGGNPAPDA